MGSCCSSEFEEEFEIETDDESKTVRPNPAFRHSQLTPVTQYVEAQPQGVSGGAAGAGLNLPRLMPTYPTMPGKVVSWPAQRAGASPTKIVGHVTPEIQLSIKKAHEPETRAYSGGCPVLNVEMVQLEIDLDRIVEKCQKIKALQLQRLHFGPCIGGHTPKSNRPKGFLSGTYAAFLFIC
ncbi:unnamed protein product [Cladocopium goreaui]|uniref:Uncharacterized protein n=1 Tax=Cladocopium goreaui TaxID=2562237 RepID=A0A9P1GDY5_9DINO|nr:unnamed protein product [Cladocopium goreaui]